MSCAASRSRLDALDAVDAEDELREHLERLGASEPWRLAEPLAAAGVGEAWLDRVSGIAGPATDAALQWVAATLTAHSLAAELRESTERMSALVSAVKTYAYMDRGELVEVDLHEGLETTLAVLGHKLKHTNIQVERDYDRELPRLTLRGSELNQVWTNLLDNAIDALGDSGTITIATRRDGNCADVSISDDGPGIPPEVAEHIFDPFFTTKDVGRGTGLGLATARRIVVDRHAGSLSGRLASRRHDLHGTPALHQRKARAMTVCTHLDHVQILELPESVGRLRGVPRHRRQLAAPAHLPRVRARRLLRRLAEQARHRARARERCIPSSARSSRARTGRGATSTTWGW